MPNPKKIAVLPFRNLSLDPEDAIFAEGITEEIIDTLAQVKGLLVSSKTSSFSLGNKGLSVDEIAGKLRVAYIIEGSIRKEGDRVKIRANLIDAASDFQFWSQSWNRQFTDLFKIQEEVSLLIADRLREDLPGLELEDRQFTKHKGPLDAYVLNLEARRLFNQWNPTDVARSIELFEEALKLDPYDAEAYVGLADAHGFLGTTLFADPVESWEKVERFTQKALELNPRHAGAHYQLANLAFFTAMDFNVAHQQALKAIEYKPNYPEARQFMAFLHMLRGDFPRAKVHLDIALEIDPFSNETRFYQAYFEYRKLNFETALHYTEACLKDNPYNIPAYTVKCYSLLGLKRYEEAILFAEAQPEEMIVASDKLGILSMAYALSENTSKFQAVFQKLQKEASRPEASQAHAYVFLIYAILNQPEKAFEWTRKCIKLKSPVLLLVFDGPFTHHLHKHSEYRVLFDTLFEVADTASPTAENNLLDVASAEAHLQKLKRYFQEEEPYLRPDLSLRSLAHELDLGPNQLSWLINQKLGKNFNTFINQYRIEYFKKSAANPDNSHISLLGLAYESGFNSKTAFNTYFKKETGLTPSQFMQTLKK